MDYELQEITSLCMFIALANDEARKINPESSVKCQERYRVLLEKLDELKKDYEDRRRAGEALTDECWKNFLHWYNYLKNKDCQ